MTRTTMSGFGAQKHGFTRDSHIVATVASHALRTCFSQLCMWALQVVFLRSAVTTAADIGHLFEAGRGCAVRAVASRAVRGSQVLIVEKGMPMYALLIQIELISGNLVGSHQLLIGVTSRAQFRHVGGVYRRARVIGLQDIMTAVTVVASSYVRVSLGQPDPVDAFLILGILICRKIIRSHEGDIGVTACA